MSGAVGFIKDAWRIVSGARAVEEAAEMRRDAEEIRAAVVASETAEIDRLKRERERTTDAGEADDRTRRIRAKRRKIAAVSVAEDTDELLKGLGF